MGRSDALQLLREARVHGAQRPLLDLARVIPVAPPPLVAGSFAHAPRIEIPQAFARWARR